VNLNLLILPPTMLYFYLNLGIYQLTKFQFIEIDNN